MIRLLRFILQTALLLCLVLWLALDPGSVKIVWRDTVIETSAAFLAAFTLALAYTMHLLFRIWHFLRNGPALWKLRRALDKERLGREQFTRALSALAAGDAAEAGRLAVSARKNSGDDAAAKWLQAQAAELAGDHGAAKELFRALASTPKTASLGYRGLVTEAKRAEDWIEVDRLLEEFRHAKPTAPWIGLMKMESAARRKKWAEAEIALEQATKLLDCDKDKNKGKRLRAALRIAASRAAAAAMDKQSALQAAEQAAKQAPHWAPAIINLAETLAALGHNRAAIRTIERAWKTTPHPQLARILRSVSENPLQALRQIERLCKGEEASPESRKALAEAAIEANVWGEARRNLTDCVEDGTATQGVYKMLARLERRERGDERAAAQWLAKAADAPTDPSWACKNCGTSSENWHPSCNACGAFNRLEWSTK